MKRLIPALAAALLVQAAAVYAQDAGEPSEQSVLEKARAKYWAQKESEAPDSQSDEAGPQAELSPDQGEAPYTPVLLSLVPGVSLPFGYYDASCAAGAIGVIARDISGAAGAGVFVTVRDVMGIEGGGVFCIARGVRGAQGAGVFNIASSDIEGGQGAGVFNIAGGKAAGLQGAGVFNIAGDSPMLIQGAGVFNIAGDVAGVQAAGVFNVAGHIKGLQVGVVNIADRIDGVQLGLVNIAGNGIDALGLSYERATSYAYAYWQAGTPTLYSIARVGARMDGWEIDYRSSVASYGFGSRSRFLGLAVDADLSAEFAVGALPYGSIDWRGDKRDWEGWSELRGYPSLRIAASLPIGPRWRIVGGVKADIDLEDLGSRVPESLKAGNRWAFDLFGEGVQVWPKWFFGLSF